MKLSSKYISTPVAAAVISAVSFALMGVWIRMMVGSFGTWQQVYLRLLIAGLIAAWIFRRHLGGEFWGSLTGRDWLIYIVRAVFAYSIGVGFFTIAIQHAALGTVSFISSIPIMGLLGWILFRERLKAATIPFIALSVIGLALLTGVNVFHLQLGWGETAAIISLLGFDIGYLMSRLHDKRRSNFQNTTVLLLLGWIPPFVISLLYGEPLISSHVSTSGWIGLALSAVMNITGLYLVNYVFTNLKAYVAGNILLLEGVFAAALGFIFYGEVLATTVLLGGVIILVCGYAISSIDAKSTTLIKRK